MIKKLETPQDFEQTIISLAGSFFREYPIKRPQEARDREDMLALGVGFARLLVRSVEALEDIATASRATAGLSKSARRQ